MRSMVLMKRVSPLSKVHKRKLASANILPPLLTSSSGDPLKLTALENSILLDQESFVLLRFCNNMNDSQRNMLLNRTLIETCQKEGFKKVFGIPRLLLGSSLESVQEQVAEYSSYEKIKGFSFECSIIASKEPDYKKAYYLFQLCCHAGTPVFLESDVKNEFEQFDIIGNALSRIINDGILDFYPELKFVVPSVLIPWLVNEHANNNPSNSLQKQSIEHYLHNNIYSTDPCTDECFVKYLISKHGVNNVLFSSSEQTAAGFSNSTISQLVRSKITGNNTVSIFNLPEKSTHNWNLNMDNVTVLDAHLNSIKLLSSRLRDKNTNSQDFMVYAGNWR